jgi:hypothetical protein
VFTATIRTAYTGYKKVGCVYSNNQDSIHRIYSMHWFYIMHDTQEKGGVAAVNERDPV